MSKRKKIVVVCPGRGSYTKETLGYLSEPSAKLTKFIDDLDQRRLSNGEVSISELDRSKAFKTRLHSKGENASPLIYACSYADFISIDESKYEIVAITGNSMGWYITLALAKALDWAGSFDLIDTMGSMMKDKLIGGQIIYPVVDESWHFSAERCKLVTTKIKEANELDGGEAYLSIHLGGYKVIAGNEIALRFLLKELPQQDPYPFQLINHGAFHTPMLKFVSQRAFKDLPQSMFQKPTVPMIDGRGKIWSPDSTNLQDLYEYTLGHQVIEPYNFSKALEIAFKEFNPDQVLLLGPGNSLGGVIGQTMIEHSWRDVQSKDDFVNLQKSSCPFLISMGLK